MQRSESNLAPKLANSFVAAHKYTLEGQKVRNMALSAVNEGWKTQANINKDEAVKLRQEISLHIVFHGLKIQGDHCL